MDILAQMSLKTNALDLVADRRTYPRLTCVMSRHRVNALDRQSEAFLLIKAL